MVWGCSFQGFILCPLPVKASVNAPAFKDIFGNATLLVWWEKFGRGPFLLYFSLTMPQCTKQDLKEEFGVKELDWPTQSPDLHPIEHLQDQLERRLWVRPSRSTSVPDLKKALLDAGATKTPQTLLVKSLPRTVGAFIAANGGPTPF